jgi:hypothetical protein
MKQLPPNHYDEDIKDLYCIRGKTMKQVADILGIAAGKVYNRLKIMGVKSRSKGDYEPTAKQIENCRKQGLKTKGRKRTKETREKLSKAKFKGGIGFKKKRTDGYVAIYFPEHPRANKDGMIMEHVLVMECFLGRALKEYEVVHHKNQKRDDNRLCNLQVMTKHEHMSYHATKRHQERRLEEAKNNGK